MLLYTMLHVSGYPHMTAGELRLYASPKAVDQATGSWKSTQCHGHPEIEVPGVEVTTGPLGQGVANAVGLAIASKHLASTFNQPGLEVISSRIFCVTGDGCLQEGVANEAIAIAGHLGLDNLVLLYDHNQVTCDGPLNWIVSEDANAKMMSMGWNVIDVLDGDTSVEAIVQAMVDAKACKGKPTFVNIRTTIGHGTSTAGTFKSHHGTFNDEDAKIYASPGLEATHTLTEATRGYWREAAAHGQQIEDEWNQILKKYTSEHPELAQQLQQRMDGNIEFEKILESIETPKDVMASRQFNGVVFNKLMDQIPNIVAGGADLWNSNQMGDQSHRIFDSKHPDGRVIRYGILEHAMASISNGLAAYSPGCFLPVTATFFMFYLYAAAGVRMGALSKLKAIHVATHDSIGEGQNGPTHQPVEVDSLFRAMPQLQYIRPADSEEVVGAWLTALGADEVPSIISLARDPALCVIPSTDRFKVKRGGYVIEEREDAEVTLISCGSELQFAVQASKELNASGIKTRVVSMPCIRLFEEQRQEYQDLVLSNSKHVVSVEAYISSMWARFCTASVAMDSYGYSGAGLENFRRFGIDTAGVVRKVKALVGQKQTRSRWQLLH
jgi:dihydroxyacetone synthase